MDGEGGLLSYRKLRFYTIKTLREDAPRHILICSFGKFFIYSFRRKQILL